MKHLFILLYVMTIELLPATKENIVHRARRRQAPDGREGAGPDAEITAGPDAVTEAGPDAGTDAGTGAGPDAGTDAGPGAGPDAAGVTTAATTIEVTTPKTTPASTTTKWKNLTLPRSLEKFYKELGPWNGMRPAHGYEPYWAGVDWIVTRPKKPKKSKKPKSTKPGETTLPPLTTTGMCGGICPLRYKTYGAICARNKRNEFRSFVNLCAMNDNDCAGLIGWLVVYRGNCTHDQPPLFPTVTIHQHARELMSNLFTTTRMTTEDPNAPVSSIEFSSSSEDSDDADGDADDNNGGSND